MMENVISLLMQPVVAILSVFIGALIAYQFGEHAKYKDARRTRINAFEEDAGQFSAFLLELCVLDWQDLDDAARQERFRKHAGQMATQVAKVRMFLKTEFEEDRKFDNLCAEVIQWFAGVADEENNPHNDPPYRFKQYSEGVVTHAQRISRREQEYLAPWLKVPSEWSMKNNSKRKGRTT